MTNSTDPRDIHLYRRVETGLLHLHRRILARWALYDL